MRLANLTDDRLKDLSEAESDLRKLERSLAYEHATGLIEGCCAPANDEATDWFDLDDVAEFAAADVVAAARYLELRGLLERDEKNPNHIAICDESEAIA